MEKIVYTQKVFETPSHIRLIDLAEYLRNEAFSLWNDSVKYYTIGERHFYDDGKIEEILYPTPQEKVVRYLQLHDVRAQRNFRQAKIEDCGEVLFCDTSFVVMFGNKLPDKAVEKRSFENAAHLAAKKAKRFKFVHIQIVQKYLGNRGKFQTQKRVAIKSDPRLHYDEVVNQNVCLMWAKGAVPENTLEYFQAFLGCF